MIKYIFILFIITGACTEVEDYYSTINKAPVLEFSKALEKDKRLIEDSVKMDFSYSTEFSIKDEEDLKIQYSPGKHCEITDDGKKILLTPKSEGLDNVSFHVTDSYGLTARGTIKLTVFRNLLPSSNFSYVVTQLDDSYILKIDAGSSYDKDAKYGGKLMFYEFTINNFKKLQSSPLLMYSINKDVIYTVKVRVQDNNLEWSGISLEYIKVGL